MNDRLRNVLTFSLTTTTAWVISGAGGAWFLNSSSLQTIPNGFAALTVVGAVAALVVSLFQRFHLQETNFFLWFLATAIGLVIGSIGASLGFLIAATLPLIQGSSGIPWVDWLAWPAIMFILTAIGGAPGGFVSGLLIKWGVSNGTIGSWIAVSMGNWSLSFGVAGVFIQIALYPHYFFWDSFHSIPVIIKGGILGLLIGMVQGLILGTHLAKLYHPELVASNSDSALTERT